MQKVISISQDLLLQHLKLSCQIPQIFEGIVAREIILETAKAEGITVEPEDLQQAADSLRLTHKLQQTEATWAWLQQHHLSLEEFEAIARSNVITSKLVKHLFSEQIESFFWEHHLEYTKAVLYEILLNDEDLIQELYYALQEGEVNFHEIAHQHIQDLDLRRLGGYRGLVSRHELRPEIAAAVYAATPPQVLLPITSPLGTHLILVEQIIHPKLDETTRGSILSYLSTEWLKQQIQQIQILPSFIDASLQKKVLQ